MNVAARLDAEPSAGAFRAAQRISAIGVSEILQIAALAAQRKQQGRPVIALAAGEPDSIRRISSRKRPRAPIARRTDEIYHA